MLELEPSDLFAEQKATAYTYPWYIRLTQRLRGAFVSVLYFLGMDVSVWNASVAFQMAKLAGMLYTFIRALYGLTPDTKFPQHWAGSRGVLPRGVYLYYRDNLDPIQQAQALYDLCLANGDFGELPPVVDVEGINNPTLTASRIRQCVERVNLLFGDVMIYTGYYVWRDQVTGDKTFAAAYKLWLAGYPFTGWNHPQDLERVKLYPPLVPAPWTHFDVWQFSSKLPANVYGVSGTYLDGNYCTEAFAAQYLNTTPPPDPIPNDTGNLMQFKTLYVLNVRSGPNTTYPDIGDLPKDTIVTALQVLPTDSNSVWVEFEPGKWVALVHNGGGPYLAFHALLPLPDPLPVAYRQTTTPANLRWSNAVNGQGYPIMSLPPVNARPKFAQGAVVVVVPEKVNADGSVDYWTVLNGNQANPPTYLQPTGYDGRWFISDLETMSL